MEDRLEEAIHVLRNHAVGQGPGLEGAHSDMHNLLAAVHNGGLGGLSPAFPNASLALSNRHPALVSHIQCVQFHRFIPVHFKRVNIDPSAGQQLNYKTLYGNLNLNFALFEQQGGKDDEATGLPPSSTLLHGHHASGPTQSAGQPEGFTSKAPNHL